VPCDCVAYTRTRGESRGLRALFEVVDNGSPGTGRDTLQIVRDDLFFGGRRRHSLPTFRSPTAQQACREMAPRCWRATSLPFDFAQDYVGTDAKPLPTSKEQCKHGGWQTFGIFRNQGDCVSFVATGGKNPPGKKP
jgi:hypothetical protein